jgi:hypothetical protein
VQPFVAQTPNRPPVGKSLWRKRIKDGAVAGIKAKTVYPPRPDNWPLDEKGQPSPWPPDKVLSLIQAGMLQGNIRKDIIDHKATQCTLSRLPRAHVRNRIFATTNVISFS